MQSISQFFLTFLLNAAWQIGLIVLAAWVCARLLRGAPARYRYRLWVTALVLSLILPILTSSHFFAGNIFDRRPLPHATDKIDLPPAPASFASAADVETPGVTIPIRTDLAVFLAVAYILFVLYNAAKLSVAWLRTRELARGAYSAPLPGCIRAAIEKCRAVTGADKAAFLFSNALAVPVTIGNLKPLVILPAEFLRETDADLLITAIGHELVHVHRRDYLFNLTFTLLFLPLSFHPAAMLLKRRIAAARELCCDEIVAERLLTAEVYARSLVTIAGSAARPDRLVPATSVGIADAGNLEARIMSLLKKSEISLYKKSFLIAAAVLLLAIPCVVAAVFVPALDVDVAGAPRDVKPEPTPPTHEASTPERREKLERELKELQDSGLDPREKEARREKLEREFKELQGGKAESVREQGEKVEKLEREMKELGEAASALDPGELEDRRKKLELELERLQNKVEVTEDSRSKLESEMAERREKEKLVAEAKIGMEQAIKNALGHQPGKLVEKGIDRSKDGGSCL